MRGTNFAQPEDTIDFLDPFGVKQRHFNGWLAPSNTLVTVLRPTP